jgi:hypothetical protein
MMMKEMKSLTLNGQKYDSFPDQEARKALENVNLGGITTAQFNALDGLFRVCAYIKGDISAEYNAFIAAFTSGGGEEPEPDIPSGAKTLVSISATYTGGSVAMDTPVNDLTGITVKAHYSDGSSETVSNYTLSGTIAMGRNIILVSYGGMRTTFTVEGVIALVNGIHTFTDGTVLTVSNGNHVSIVFNTNNVGSSDYNDASITISNLTQNSNIIDNPEANVYNKPTWFSVNPGEKLSVVLSNYTQNLHYPNAYASIGFKYAESDESITELSMGKDTKLYGEFTPNETCDIGNMLVYAAEPGSGDTIEFDVSIIVENV